MKHLWSGRTQALTRCRILWILSCPILCVGWLPQRSLSRKQTRSYAQQDASFSFPLKGSFSLSTDTTTTSHSTAGGNCTIVPIHSIELNQVTVQYESSWWSSILSSVPRRAHALQNLSASLQPPQVLLVTGDSLAGKSTLLQVVAGQLSPTHGSVVVKLSLTDESQALQPFPVYLEASADVPKYDYGSSSSKVTKSTFDLVDQVLSKVDSSISGNRNDMDRQVQLSLARRLLPLFWTEDEITKFNSHAETSWSQSQIYRTRLWKACLQSMLYATSAKDGSGTSNLSSAITLPAPILLLDEWLDRETSSVIQSVQASLEALVRETGAMVLVVTHYPQRWSKRKTTDKRNNDERDDPASLGGWTHQWVLSMGRLCPQSSKHSS